MRNRSRLWVAGYFLLVLSALGIVGSFVVHIDPFFHYHKPLTDGYFYTLSNQRSQNDGITKHFDYDALITGTSMTENFKTSEADAIFGVRSVKVSYSGGTYKEINDNLTYALTYHPDLKIIIRGLDIYYLFVQKDALRDDQGVYPTYLYDQNLLNDVRYIFNRNVVFNWVYPMTQDNEKEGFKPGITSFDQYSNWMQSYTFGLHSVCPGGVSVKEPGAPVHLAEEEREIIIGNVRQNVTSLAAAHPDVAFYYFIPPYGILEWKELVDNGRIYRQIEAERVMIEEILQYDNIKLYSFNNRTDITTDLNNYKDNGHYGSWVNSLMLRWMRDGRYLLTKDNYQDYLAEEFSFYTTYDYSQLAGQEDYGNDYYAAALVCEELNGVEPLVFTEELLGQGQLNRASVLQDAYNGLAGIQCQGAIGREPNSEVSVGSYLAQSEYIGCRLSIEDISPYSYLVFYGKKSANHGQPSVFLYDRSGNELKSVTASYPNLDSEWHQYLLDISDLTGEVTMIFNGGYVDSTGSPDSLYTFGGITLY